VWVNGRLLDRGATRRRSAIDACRVGVRMIVSGGVTAWSTVDGPGLVVRWSAGWVGGVRDEFSCWWALAAVGFRSQA
jgi:hypothetical protein